MQDDNRNTHDDNRICKMITVVWMIECHNMKDDNRNIKDDNRNIKDDNRMKDDNRDMKDDNRYMKDDMPYMHAWYAIYERS